jgi:hypothetical protein
MSFHRIGTDYLGIGLTARMAINTLVGFYETEKVWHASETGIEIIKEVRDVLQRLNESEHSTSFLFFNRQGKHFESYYEMQFLKEVAVEMEWTTWESDLDQWLMNKEKVLDYFMNLESHSLGRHRHSDRGCL